MRARGVATAAGGVVLVVALAGGCATPPSSPAPAAGPSPVTAIPDTSLGLVPGSVFDTPTPPPVKPDESMPGERPVPPRPYTTAPPRIPHATGDFLPITRTQNMCIDCHAVKEKKPGEPTPIPASHYTDYRGAPDRVGPQVVGARYVCVSCHIGRTDAPELVGNRFRP
jgi:nitrate reductase cytochrome c-type subunit